jgi:D-alanine-D-alanine ligase
VRVLILHSDIPPDAPADEQDTLLTVQAIVEALESRGHRASCALFTFDRERLRQIIAENRTEAVFNMVEAIFRQGELASAVCTLLEKLNVPFSGTRAAPMALAGDKPLAKRVLRLGGLPTPDWDDPPFNRLEHGRRYIVKSATEDASLGLDDDAVVQGQTAVRKRAEYCRETHGGRWFAEAYVHGREFNVSVIEQADGPRVLPIPEMEFLDWDSRRPRLVGYAAKWEEECPDSLNTVRKFIDPVQEAALCNRLTELSLAAWHLFALQGFARVDFRVDTDGDPYILELNPNPCLEPGSGLAAAAAQAGVSYADLVEQILMSAKRAHSVA